MHTARSNSCWLATAALLLSLIGSVFSQNVSLTRRFAAWNDPIAWSDGAAAGPGKNYVVDATGQDLTSPRAFSPRFPGDALDLQSGGNLDLRHFGGSASIADLTLSGGAITHGAGRAVGVGGLNEVITVTADSRLVVVRTSQTLEVRSRLSGAGGLTAEGASVEPGDRATIALLGVGTDYTGEWTVSNVSLNAVTPGSMGTGNVTITEGTLDFDYRYDNAAGSLTIRGGESRLLLDQDIVFGEVFFGDNKIPDGVHPWSFFDEIGAGEQILDGGGRLIIGDQDADDDGMADAIETDLFGDTSKDADADEDGDGLSNLAEVQGNSDPTKADTDADGLNDSAEIAAGSDPTVEDTDGDGLTDQAEIETTLTNPRSVDTDGDNLSDGQESTNGTNPLLADSDADGFDDGTELAAGSDANNAEDKPSGSFIPAQVEVGAPVILDVRFSDEDEPIATKEANMALNTDEPEILFVTTSTDATGLKDPVTGEDAMEAVVGFFMDPRTLEQTRDPFVILGNPDASLRRLDVKYNPISKQYVVVTSARDYRPSGQVVPLIALVNPNSVAGEADPVAKAFAYDGDTSISYDDVAVAVSTNNGNILLVGEYKFEGEGEGVVGAMFDKDGNVLTPVATRLDRLQAVGDEDDPDVLFLPNNDAFVFLVNTDGDGADDLKNRITGSIIQASPDANGQLLLGEQVALGSNRLEGNREGHAAAIENPFTDELIGAFDYANGDDGGDLFYFQVGDAPDFTLTTTRDQIPYLEATGNNPYNHRHPQLSADPNSGVIVVGHHVRGSAADPALPNGFALTVLGPDGAVLPGRNELNNGFHAFLENEAPTDNDPNWTNVKYDPLSDSFIVVFADGAGETKVVRFTVVSNHLEQPSQGGGEPGDSHYAQNFAGFADDTTDLGDGSIIASNDGLNSIQGGVLRMTQAETNSSAASFILPPFDASAGWTATFDFTIEHTGENTPADGFSFNYGAIPDGQNFGDPAEEGYGAATPHVSFQVDTWLWDDAAGQDAGVGIEVTGVEAALTKATDDDANFKPNERVSASATVSWDPANGASFSTTGLRTNANFSNIPTDGFSGDASHGFSFLARTGGHNETLEIDNLVVSPLGDGGGEPEPDGPLFREDFEGLTLGPNVDEGVVGEMVWTAELPAGWTIDNSQLFGADEEGIGVTEWKGWTFANKDWWIEAAGDQRRSEWLNGKGTVMIADPDEWDDIGGPGGQEQGGFNTFISLPAISLEGLPANTAVLSFDSSWRPEFDDNFHQSGNLKVSFDGGAPIELFEWLSDPGSPNFKGEAIDERAIVPLNNPEGATSMVITFGMFDAGNDWWWAIDNIEVATGAVLSKIVGRRSNVLLEITDTGTSKINADSVSLKIDGQTVHAEITKVDGVVRIEYSPTPPFVAGSQHTYAIEAQDEAGAAVNFDGNVDVPVPLLPEDPLPGPLGVDGEFGVRYIWGGGTLNNVSHAVDAIAAVEAGTWEGVSFDITHPFINHGDGNGLFPEDETYPEEVESDEEGLWTDEDFLQFSKATIRVPESGEYTFGVQTDDGFAFRIFGAEFSKVQGNGQLDPGNSNTMAHPGTTGNSSTRGTVTLARGDYDIEFMWFERGGGDFGELYVAKGAFAGDGDTDTWQLLGRPADGETAFVTLVGSPLAVPEITAFALADGNATIDFTTPDASVNHVLQTSVDLVDWEPSDAEELVDAGDSLTRQFEFPRAAEANLYYRVAVLPPPAILADDFENGVGDWTVETAAGDTAWELGTPNAGGLTAAASGTNAWGTSIAGEYSSGSVTSLKSPLIDLTGIGRPKLSFNYFIDSTQDVEGGQLRFLNEAGEAVFTRQEIFSGKTETWTAFNLTIPREARDQKIFIEFRFLSDPDNAVGAGWYIDDVIVDR